MRVESRNDSWRVSTPYIHVYIGEIKEYIHDNDRMMNVKGERREKEERTRRREGEMKKGEEESPKESGV